MAEQDIISLTQFKNDASGWIERLQSQPPIVLTQNGQGRAVVQSYESYQQTRDSMAMLSMVVRGAADATAGRVTPHEKVFANLRRELQDRSGRSKPERDA